MIEPVKFKPSYELQLLDSNCSDCVFMKRSISKRQESVDKHYQWQKNHFDVSRMKNILRAEYWLEKEEKEKAKLLLGEARKMVFQFDESDCAIHFGSCSKFKKEVTFIPNILQLETQQCFKHRKQL